MKAMTAKTSGGHGAQHEEVSGANIDAALGQHFLQERRRAAERRRKVSKAGMRLSTSSRSRATSGAELGWF
jgi:hypothetical protein